MSMSFRIKNKEIRELSDVDLVHAELQLQKRYCKRAYGY